jgi:hypothetical protein
MPFSFSQYSKTAKKSAFISVCEQKESHEGNKKVGKFYLSDFGALGKPSKSLPFYLKQ